MHIVLLTKTALNRIKFNSSKQNFNFSKCIPRERGGLPVFHKCAIKFIKYSPRMRGSTYGGVSGCRYANISLHMQGSTRSCAASFDHRNIPRERGGQPTVACPGAGMRTFPLRKQGCPILADIGNLSIRLPPALAGMFRRAPNSNNLLRFEFPVRGVGSQKQMPLSTYHAFSLLSQSWLKRKEEGCPVGARLALHWQGPFNRQ